MSLLFRSCRVVVSVVLLVGWVVPSSSRGDETTDAEEKRRQLHYYLKGRYLYQKKCTTCHGRTGRGDGPWAAELEDRPRNFRTGLFKFRTTPYGALPTGDDLRRTIRSGISGTAMPFFANLTEEEVSALIVYLQTLSRAWDEEDLQREPLELPEAPAWFGRPDERREHGERGRPLFATHCASCHGAEGRGDGPAGRALVDAWEHAIVPADLSAEHHKSGDAPADLYRSIATGLNGTPMVGFAETLEADQIWDLVAYIGSLSSDREIGSAP